MLYSEYIEKAIELTITEDTYSGLYYLDPHYKVKLADAELLPDCVSDHPMDMYDLYEVLKLEVDRQNVIHNNSKYCVDFLAEIISSTIIPSTINQENELVKNLISYMKLNDSLKDKEAELDKKEKNLDDKSNVAKIAPGMSFAKRK